MCTGKLNTGTLRETVRERVASPGRRLREFVQVHRCTMSKQSGDGWPRQGGLCGECVRNTRRYTKQLRIHPQVRYAQAVRHVELKKVRVAWTGRRLWRVCAPRVLNTGTLRARGQVELEWERMATPGRTLRRACTGSPTGTLCATSERCICSRSRSGERKRKSRRSTCRSNSNSEIRERRIRVYRGTRLSPCPP